MRKKPTSPSEFEWPTWLLWSVILASWAVLVGTYGSIPTWLSTMLLIVLVAWYMSFQHELTHGHPTHNETINRLIGLLPLAIWYPFDTYKKDHLKHHDDAHLTEPGVDFPVVQVVIPGYSDILPFHPASSPVLFKGWTRDLAMGEYKAAGGPRACSASGLFPNW